MRNTYKNSSIKNKKIVYYIVLAIVAVLTVLMCIDITRAGLVGIFGWAICAYLPAIALLAVLLLSGKSFKVSKVRLALYISLFIMVVCTLHIMLAKSLINGGGSYILEPIQGYNTVGGMLISLVTAPFKLLFKKYGYFLTFYFVCTAVLGLAVLYPFVFNIKDFKKKQNDKNIIKSNPIPTKNSLLVDDIEPKKTQEELPTFSPLTEGHIDNYKPLIPKDKPLLFNEIIDEHTINAAKEQRSASILFGKQPPEKTEEQPKENRFQFFNGENNTINTYTNQARQKLFEDNIKKTFGEQTSEQDYKARFGDIKVFNPIGGEVKISEQIDEYPLASKTPTNNDSTMRVTQQQKADYSTLFKDIAPNFPQTNSENSSAASQSLYQKSNLPPQTNNETLPQSALDRLYSAEKMVEKEEATLTPQQPKKILNPLEYINTPLRADEYANMDLIRPIADIKESVVEEKPVVAPRESAETFARPIAKPIAQQQNLFGTAEKVAKPIAKMRPYIAPPLDMLTQYPYQNSNFPTDYEETKRKIEEALVECNLPAEVFNAIKGPAFTRYEIKLGPGLQPQKVVTQQRLLMMRLCAENMRILAPIKGKDAVGIELPNAQREMVGLSSILASREFASAKNGIYVGFGKDIEGQPIVANIAKMPHLLVAGATGTGKSVFINSLIVSILYKYSPEDVRLLLIDPKRVELSVYQNLPNLLIKDTIKEPQHAVNLLVWLCNEMDNRYRFLEQFGCNEIDAYNDNIRDKTREPKIPRIVLIVDEMADLMIKGKGQVEEYIVRIAQLGRACGIHLVLATQRPTVNVITGLIRSNILSRVAFTVKTNQDSRIIFDEGGAENLLGNGDMIYSHGNDMDRIQGAYVDIRDIKKICDFIRMHNDANFDDSIANKVLTAPPEEENKINVAARADAQAAEKDADFEAILKRVLKTFILEKRASVSSAQAKHNVGYIKAKKLVDAMTERGYITKEEGAKPREVLIDMDEFIQIYGED